MPTDRPRLTITETDDVVEMLNDAAKRWPEDRAHRARLLKRLAERGAEAVRTERAGQHEAWTTLVKGAAVVARQLGVGIAEPDLGDATA